MRIIDQLNLTVAHPAAIRALNKTGALAALLAALLFRRNLDAEWYLLRASGLFTAGPGLALHNLVSWFNLLQQSPLLGLTLLNFFDLVNYFLVGLFFLAVLLALFNTHLAGAVLSGTLWLAGAIAYLMTNQALRLLALSRQYALAASDAQRDALLVTGHHALDLHLSNNFAGSGLHPSFLLVTLAGLIISLLMLRSPFYNRRISFTGILANIFSLSYYLLLVFAPAFTFVSLSISAVFLLAWYLMLARWLWSL